MTQEFSNFRCIGGASMYAQQSCPYPLSYFEERECVIDCRAPGCLVVEDGGHFGWFVTVFTLTHDFGHDRFGDLLGKKTIIRKGAFVCACATLFNCEIGEGAIVAIGSVVRSMKVEPYTMVEGNPARVFKRKNRETGKWERV